LNNIVGLGNDIINITRIEKSIAKFGDKFINKLYTPKEILLAGKFGSKQKLYSFYAKRFAAKEALVKAIGTGFSKDISFKDIEILNNEQGKPIVYTYNKLNTLLKHHLIHISLSDDYPFAMATILVSSSYRPM